MNEVQLVISKFDDRFCNYHYPSVSSNDFKKIRAYFKAVCEAIAESSAKRGAREVIEAIPETLEGTDYPKPMQYLKAQLRKEFL